MLAKRMFSFALILLLLPWSSTVAQEKKDRNTLVRDDRSRVLQDGFWIYNDVDKGLAQAQATDKPLLVIFRCIPCEACAQLDEAVVENNPAVRKWLSRFVCVRVVHTNGMDLSRFQFDYDQSWCAFFMNADGTIYGRYGTRSHQTESDNDVTLDGFLATMKEVLALHDRFPEVRGALQAKTGPQAAVAVPEEFPKLKDRYTSELAYEAEVARSCIHCHQVGEAWLEWHRDSDQPLASSTLFPYPHPKILGLIMDPKSAVTVQEVVDDSWADQAGFQAGDQIRKLDGQPIISMADMQWVLHHADNQDKLAASVERSGQKLDLTLNLPEGWRETGDVSWRVTSWAKSRMVLGGLRLESLPADEAKRIDDPGVSLRVRVVGQFNEHAAGKRAGFKKDDVIVAIDGLTEPMSESQLFAHLLRTKESGDKVDVVVLRDGNRRNLKLPIQD